MASYSVRSVRFLTDSLDLLQDTLLVGLGRESLRPWSVPFCRVRCAIRTLCRDLIGLERQTDGLSPPVAL